MKPPAANRGDRDPDLLGDFVIRQRPGALPTGVF